MEHERKPTIVWDFDGTLTEKGPWGGHAVIYPPRKKVMNVIRRLHKVGVVHHISTCRLNPNPFGKGDDPAVLSGRANRTLCEWLSEQGMLPFFDEITGWKIYGDLYVDDRMLGWAAVEDMEEDELYNYLTGILTCAGLLEVGKC